MSKRETPKSWQQAENKRGRGIFKSTSHFSDGHLLRKLLSPDSWDNPHKDSWPVSETKTNKGCRTAISHPWLEADCGPAPLFPPLDFASSAVSQPLLTPSLQGSFHERWETRACSQCSACCTESSFQSLSNPYSVFQWKLGTSHGEFKLLPTSLLSTFTFDAILCLSIPAD